MIVLSSFISFGYCRIYWAGDPINRRYTNGYCTFIEGNLVTWRCKKNIIARSCVEIEYRTMAHTACELIWIQSLFFLK